MDQDQNDIRQATPSDAQGTQDLAYYLTRLNPLQFRKRGRKTKALAALVLICFLWGSTWLAAKEGVKHMPALQMAGIRQILAGTCLVLFFTLKRAAWPRGKEWRVVIILSVLNFLLSNALSTWGVKFVSAGLGAVIGATFPLWLVIIGLFGSRTKAQPKTVSGLLLGFTGICVIFYEHLSDFLDADFRFGIFISLASSWAWAIGALYTKKQAANFNPYFSLGLQMVLAGIVLFCLTQATGMAIPIAAIPWQSWAAIGYLTVFGSLMAFVAYLYVLQNLPTEQASIYAYINPVVAVLLGAIIFGEHLTPFIICGTLITLYGVYLVNRTAMKAR
ncbi:MAG: drug/metabolite-transporting permease [Flaviaesturariibacter sp.]|nr:drug/metabolite-transporting permease [Flaviaesturariibacter sp.]